MGQATIHDRYSSHPTLDKALNIILWIVQLGLALVFVASGVNKLAGHPDMIALFDTVGLGQWFRYVTGIFEVAGAVMLVLPMSRFIGAGLLACVMVGAIATHLFVLHNSPALPVILFALLLFVLWGRRHDVSRLTRSSSPTLT